VKGIIRIAQRYESCPNCGVAFQNLGKQGYMCPQCLTVPKRFYIDIHHRGQRVPVFSDKQGKPLDTFDRAYDLLAHINYEIDNFSFEPQNYKRSEREDVYFSNRIEGWIKSKEDDLLKGNLAPSTLKAYRIYVNRFYVPFFKNEDIREIRTGKIDEFYHQLPNQLSTKYIKTILDGLENFFNSLLRLEYITRKPIFPKIKVNEKAPKWIIREVQDKILSSISEIDRGIIYFLTRQGLRQAEARALKIRDLDFEIGALLVQRTFSAGVLIERTKTKKEKYRLINPELLPMLEKLCKNRFPDEFIFVNPRTKRPYCDKTLNNIWNKACRDIGMEISLNNATRHSVASQAACKGAPMQAIGAALGHCADRSTRRYAMTDLASQMIVFEMINNPIANIRTSANRQQETK